MSARGEKRKIRLSEKSRLQTSTNVKIDIICQPLRPVFYRSAFSLSSALIFSVAQTIAFFFFRQISPYPSPLLPFSLLLSLWVSRRGHFGSLWPPLLSLFLLSLLPLFRSSRNLVFSSLVVFCSILFQPALFTAWHQYFHAPVHCLRPPRARFMHCEGHMCAH